MKSLLSISACVFAFAMVRNADAQAPNPAREQQIMQQLAELHKQAQAISAAQQAARKTAKRNVLTLKNLPPGSYTQSNNTSHLDQQASNIFRQIQALQSELRALQAAAQRAKYPTKFGPKK